MRSMKTRIVSLLTMVAFIALSSAFYAQSRRTNRSASISMDNNVPVTDCGAIRVTYDRQPAVTEETQMSLSASQVSTLRARISKGGIYVNGWDRSEYSIKTCKAVPAG